MAPFQRKIDVYDNLWGIDMRILMDHLIERNGIDRIFGYLPEMCKNSPCQLGALTSESFSERMISAANLLVTTHRLHLDHDHIDKMVVLRMNKRFMERVRRKEAFTSIAFKDVLVEETYVSPNEDWKY